MLHVLHAGSTTVDNSSSADPRGLQFNDQDVVYMCMCI